MQLLGWVTAAAFAPPKAALEQDLLAGTLQAALDEMAKTYGLAPPKLPKTDLRALQIAHTSLFVSNPDGLPCPPYVGMALDERLFGLGFERLMALYRLAGLEVSPDWRDLPDHLAAVGEAIALLGEKPELARTLALEYLYPWLKRYAPVLQEADPTGFYSSIAVFLSKVLEEVNGETRAAQLP
ncbi:MAG: molecular chaperone TorD family protein [Meiothermus sp.]|uniref:TorD/DmsD family molecular chaperone n=1 Tax=Meiothermus sp. TaxID=1955249 RepID=UPI00298EFEDA|nr:molecular chaperone TorD family protein [Meiothermus sp.]MDW8425751.1 molecular chaperone TorD family protein [Meiothermus sp.]